MNKADVIIIGASAAGLMCAIEAGKRQRKVVVLDHANKAGKKILMSGGGCCNFTNYDIQPENYLSHNESFCKSALRRYTQWDFISLVEKYNIPYHEKKHGQLFCDNKASDILNMLLAECQRVGVHIHLKTTIEELDKYGEEKFILKTSRGELECESLVIASGGLSIPTMGATPFGYKVAEQFGINIWPTRAGLVPFTLHSDDKEKLADLSGISVSSRVRNDRQSFNENILFTHRGLSGPAILQISSYWQPGEVVDINLLPEINFYDELLLACQRQPQQKLKSCLAEYLPKRVAAILCSHLLGEKISESTLQSLAHKQFQSIATQFQQWQIKPNGTEGYRTAEVTLGGVDCAAISSKTMQANAIPGLYFIGEVLDVSGWLGGYNFQWAWSSGWAAGNVV